MVYIIHVHICYNTDSASYSYLHPVPAGETVMQYLQTTRMLNIQVELHADFYPGMTFMSGELLHRDITFIPALTSMPGYYPCLDFYAGITFTSG